jgi:hypothetical protein
MVLIKVKYDAYNRIFKPLGGESVKALEDGETYMLIADVVVDDLKPVEAAGDGPSVSAGERPFLVGLY